MILNQRPIQKTHILLLLAGASLLCVAGLSHAQEAPIKLPIDAAEQQAPPSFPNADSSQTEKILDSALKNETEEQKVAAPEGVVPPQPEEKKLVPATPMGSAAQTAGKYTQADEPATPALTESEPENTESPALPDILEKYTSKNEALSAEEDLPEIAIPKMSDMGLIDDGLATGIPNQKTPEQLKAEIQEEAYDAALTGTFPLTPEQISILLKRYDETQQVVEKPVFKAPTPEISVQNISLDPGVLPPVVKTAVGNVTTINMLDATGAPWPVQDVTWAGDFEIVEPEEGGHIIRITPMAHSARGNIVIRMLTLKTPLTMTLETSRDIVQYRIDARIPEYGPFATAPLMQGGKSSLVAGSPDLTSLLDGVAVNNMMKLQVSGVDGRTTAYSMGGQTYVRTPLTLLSPAWQSSVSSADGMNVYALSSAPVLLLSDGGEFVRAMITEKKELLDE